MTLRNITCPNFKKSELRYVPDKSVRVGTSLDTWKIRCGFCHVMFEVPRPDLAGTMHHGAIVDGADVSA